MYFPPGIEPACREAHALLPQRDACRSSWLLFSKPGKILEATTIESVLKVLDDTDRIVRDKNKFAAGFVSYEASLLFDSAFPIRRDSGFPLAWFGILSEPRVDSLRGLFTACCRHTCMGAVYGHRGLLRSLFTRMLGAQKGGHGAFINIRDRVIGSASPELFFKLSDQKPASRPMKDTAPRSPGYESDPRSAATLGHCE